MNAILPDVSRTEKSQGMEILDWVGMEGIDLPLTIVETGYKRDAHAKADIQVNLPEPHVKGIHMSRLYHLLDQRLGSGLKLAPQILQSMLEEAIASHRDCGSTKARIKLQFPLLAKRPALITDGMAGWNSYPVTINASLTGGSFHVRVEAVIGYSSTCPCSAALSRQLVEQGFLEAFGDNQVIDTAKAAAWIRENSTLATPHSQRSEARVSFLHRQNNADNLGLLALIDQVEGALKTPVQTAVKRADEQAFAALNGQNLMFVEDAARRIKSSMEDYAEPEIYVRHLESLHPHDAVAYT